jgi:hypothetical protein
MINHQGVRKTMARTLFNQISSCRLASKLTLALIFAGLSAPGGFTADSDQLATGAVITQSHKEAYQDLASRLKAQSRDLSSQLNSVSRANLEKLRPALQRQRNVLLSPQVLAVDPNSRAVISSSTSGSSLVVGSIGPVETSTQPALPLARFHSRLKSLKLRSGKRQLTILHVSQGSKTSRLFAQNIRSDLRNLFGDAGHGMVSPARQNYQLGQPRFEVTQTGRWRAETKRLRNKAGFGLSGRRLSSRSSMSSLSFASLSGSFDWAGVTIATGPSQGVFTLKVGDVEQKFDAQASVPGSRFFRLDARGTKMTVTPGGGAKTGILSWHAGKVEPGIRYVDFELSPTPSGQLGRYETTLLKNDLHQLAPDLLIIDGFSEHRPEFATDDKAKKEFEDLVAQIRASAPQSDVLYLGADSSGSIGKDGSCIAAPRPEKMPSNGSPTSPPAARQPARHKPSTAHWSWSSTAENICSISNQLKHDQAVRQAVEPNYNRDRLRAKAFVRWLTQPVSMKPNLVRR